MYLDAQAAHRVEVQGGRAAQPEANGQDASLTWLLPHAGDPTVVASDLKEGARKAGNAVDSLVWSALAFGGLSFLRRQQRETL